MKNRLVLPLLRILLVSLIFSPNAFSQDTVMRIKPPAATQTGVGDIFSVDIAIENGQNVAGCQVWLTYNPTVLEYADFEKGRFFPADAFYGKIQLDELSSTKARLRFAVTSAPHQNSGDGTIITLFFRVLAVNPWSLLNLVEGDLSSGTGILLSDATGNLLSPHVDDHGNTPADATPLSSDVDWARWGGIKPNSDVDYFEVKISGPGELRLYTFLGRDVVIELQDSTGSVLPANDDIEDGLIANLRLRHNVNAGIYYVKVTGTTENSIGNFYGLRANFTPEFDDGNTRAEATQLHLPLSSPRVGWIEPAIVRLIYIYPSNKEAREDVQDALLGKMEAVQHFYATHLGGKTFQYDKELLSIQSDITTETWNMLFKNHFQVASEHFLFGEVEAKWNAERKPTDPYTPDKDIYLVVIDHISLGGSRGGAWSKGHGGEAFVPGLSMPWPVIAHELGHTFGLRHQYDDKRYLMNHHGTLEDAGLRRRDAGFWENLKVPFTNIRSLQENLIPFFDTTILSNSDKHWLEVLPAFNYPASPSTAKTHLTVTGNTDSHVTISASDPDGIHQIQLLVPGEGGLQLKRWATFEKTEIEFSFDISDLWEDREEIEITFQVIDKLGDITEATEFGGRIIEKASVKGAPTKVEGQQGLRPKKTALLANYPNPFNPETWIPYQLATSADVTLTIYDINGRVVRDLDFGHQRSGIYHNRNRAAYWDGRNAFGEPVASGVYFYTLTAGDFTATRKLLIRK
ncbi:hypothetical protein C6503_03450 [Candidatus Poribacteria bacterium]|nr:MAG: hypothetical protein C6503_03450 [Candidatus Poribacteria bacterium]